jgi:hypothetical protein
MLLATALNHHVLLCVRVAVVCSVTEALERSGAL